MWVHVYVVPYLHAPLCATGIVRMNRALAEGAPSALLTNHTRGLLSNDME